MAWEDLKGKVAEVAVEVCRVSRKKIGVKRTKWWNEEEQKVVTERKLAHTKGWWKWKRMKLDRGM